MFVCVCVGHSDEGNADGDGQLEKKDAAEQGDGYKVVEVVLRAFSDGQLKRSNFTCEAVSCYGCLFALILFSLVCFTP